MGGGSRGDFPKLVILKVGIRCHRLPVVPPMSVNETYYFKKKGGEEGSGKEKKEAYFHISIYGMK